MKFWVQVVFNAGKKCFSIIKWSMSQLLEVGPENPNDSHTQHHTGNPKMRNWNRRNRNKPSPTLQTCHTCPLCLLKLYFKFMLICISNVTLWRPNMHEKTKSTQNHTRSPYKTIGKIKYQDQYLQAVELVYLCHLSL